MFLDTVLSPAILPSTSLSGIYIWFFFWTNFAISCGNSRLFSSLLETFKPVTFHILLRVFWFRWIGWWLWWRRGSCLYHLFQCLFFPVCAVSSELSTVSLVTSCKEVFQLEFYLLSLLQFSTGGSSTATIKWLLWSLYSRLQYFVTWNTLEGGNWKKSVGFWRDFVNSLILVEVAWIQS